MRIAGGGRGIDRNLADQRRHCATRQTGVAVQRDDKAHAFGRAGTGVHEGRLGAPQQQVVQLGQFAALALPAHPYVVGFVPDPGTMQQVEAASGTLVFLCQSLDRFAGVGQYLGVRGGEFCCGI